MTDTLQGPWYSANDLSVFILLDAYLNVTGDRVFLAEPIGDRTVLEHLDAISTHWKSLVRPGRTLADYGKASNLLECVPTYIHEVASFNAANVWMMRHVAGIDDQVGNPVRASELRQEADRLLPAVLALYEPGQGVWDSLHRDGTRVQIRHVFDFATIGLTIKDDLSPKMRSEMTDFVERELLVDHWMRAQSLSDVAAAQSNRPDHGPMGAYCAWPAETIAVLDEFGEFGRALDFLHRCVDVTTEGPYSQSRALLGKAHDSPIRIAPAPSRTMRATAAPSPKPSFANASAISPTGWGRLWCPIRAPAAFRADCWAWKMTGGFSTSTAPIRACGWRRHPDRRSVVLFRQRPKHPRGGFMVFHESGQEIGGAGVVELFRAVLDVMPQVHDHRFMEREG